MRIALTSDVPVTPLREPLARALAPLGVAATFNLAGSDPGVCLDPVGALWRGRPEIAVMVYHLEHLAPELLRAATLLGPAADRAAICERAAGELLERARAAAAVWAQALVANLLTPPRSPLGICDGRVELGLSACVRRINDRLEEGLRGVAGARLLDLAAVGARLGAAHLAPESAALHYALASEIGRHVSALLGCCRRALVLDLDNTLWGGGAGELGDVLLSPSGAGRPWYNFQQACLDLYERGVVLAVAAKCDPAAALRVMRGHPHMLLRPEHFAAMEIHWGDKVSSLLKIAGQLRIGLNELAFFDDNPLERGVVSGALPEVAVIPAPADPSRFAEVLAACEGFESIEPEIGGRRVRLSEVRAA